MLTLFLSAVGALGALFAPANGSQDPVEASMRTGPRDARFLAGFAVEHNGDWVVEIFRLSGDGAALHAVRSLRTPSEREQVTTIDDTGCPALRDVASALSDLPSAAIRIPGISPHLPFSPPPGPSPSGASYSVWGVGRQADGAFAHVSFKANAGLLANIVQQANDALMPCWSQQGGS